MIAGHVPLLNTPKVETETGHASAAREESVSRADRTDVAAEGVLVPAEPKFEEAASTNFAPAGAEIEEDAGDIIRHAGGKPDDDNRAGHFWFPEPKIDGENLDVPFCATVARKPIVDPIHEWWNEPLEDWREGKLEIRSILTGRVTVIDLRRRDDDAPF